MRLTVRDHNCHKYDVFFNGVKQTKCVTADEEAGYIIIVEGRGTMDVRHTRLEGEVKIVKKGL